MRTVWSQVYYHNKNTGLRQWDVPTLIAWPQGLTPTVSTSVYSRGVHSPSSTDASSPFGDEEDEPPIAAVGDVAAGRIFRRGGSWPKPAVPVVEEEDDDDPFGGATSHLSPKEGVSTAAIESGAQ